MHAISSAPQSGPWKAPPHKSWKEKYYLKKPGTSLCPNSLCIILLCRACLSKRCMTMRCCGEMRGVSQPEERVAITRLGLGSMLAVDDERRDRAIWVLVIRVEGCPRQSGRAYCCLRWSRRVSFWVVVWLGSEAQLPSGCLVVTRSRFGL
jgi:hypothetical protein